MREECLRIVIFCKNVPFIRVLYGSSSFSLVVQWKSVTGAGPRPAHYFKGGGGDLLTVKK